MNEFIQELSLKFCSLDQDCARGLMEMLIYSKSKLKQLYLNGNNLRNEGTIKVLKGVSAAKELVKIHLADNQFNDDQEVLDAIKSCMTTNKNLGQYDFQYNDLKDAAVEFFLDILGPEDEENPDNSKISWV